MDWYKRKNVPYMDKERKQRSKCAVLFKFTLIFKGRIGK